MAAKHSPKEQFWLRIIYIVSAVLILAVAFLIYGPRPDLPDASLDVSALPTLNAILNGLSTALLLAAFISIKLKHIQIHKNLMLAAFGSSGLFLTSYVMYHGFSAGPREYTGTVPALYFFVLITHIILAMAIVPLALVSLYRGWNDMREQHRKIARITFPIWLYVSITGIAIYLMLY